MTFAISLQATEKKKEADREKVSTVTVTVILKLTSTFRLQQQIQDRNVAALIQGTSRTTRANSVKGFQPGQLVIHKGVAMMVACETSFGEGAR